MYPEDEIEISKANLTAVISNVEEPVCLLGGWAVYITVNKNFNTEQGRDYIGSRDIDLGFHIDATWSDEELQKSAFSKSIKILKDIRYCGIGSRFVQHYDLVIKKILIHPDYKNKNQRIFFIKIKFLQKFSSNLSQLFPLVN